MSWHILPMALVALSSYFGAVDACPYFFTPAWSAKVDNYKFSSNAACTAAYNQAYFQAGQPLRSSNTPFAGASSDYLIGNSACLTKCIAESGPTLTAIYALLQTKLGTIGYTAADVELTCYCNNDFASPFVINWADVEAELDANCPP